MSRGARWTLGAFCILFAWVFAISANPTLPHSSVLYIPAAFCVVIAIACFSRQMRGPAVRFIGIFVFGLTLSYFIYEISHHPRASYRSSSQPHWINAAITVVVFGLPGLAVAKNGEYPFWGRGAAGFGSGDQNENPDEDRRGFE